MNLNTRELEIFDGAVLQARRGFREPRRYFAGISAATIGAVAATVGAGAAVYGAVNSGGGANGTQAQAQSPTQTANDIYGAEQANAPGVLSLTQQNAPQYNALQQQLLGNTSNNLIGNYQSQAPDLQGLQNQANQLQAGGTNDLLNAYGANTVSAFQNANPQLQQIQNQYTNMALTPQNPVSQYSGAGSWAQPYAQQVGQQVAAGSTNAQQINPSQLGFTAQNAPQVGMGGTNATNAQLQQTAQQQLALGTSMSQQQSATVANEVLSNYNSMGRANDPTAIAGLATGLDTYGQQLLTQREGNAATAAGLQTGQQQLGQAAQQSNQAANLSVQGLGLQGATTQAGLTQNAALANQSTNLSSQQSNLSALLSGLGLQGAALSTGGQQQLTQQANNQQAQLSNANYQAQLMTGAAGLAQSTANPALSSLMSQSGALTAASNLTNQAGTTITAGNQLSSMYNPFSTGAFNSVYSGQTGNNQFNASANQGILGAGLSILGSSSSLNGLTGLFNGIGKVFNTGASGGTDNDGTGGGTIQQPLDEYNDQDE